MQRKKIMIIIVLLILISSIGVSLAFFGTIVEGNNNSKNISAVSKSLKLLFEDGETISVENIEPGWTAEKTFTVKNKGSVNLYYSINYGNLVNTFINDEMIYILSCTRYSNYENKTISGTCDGITSSIPYSFNESTKKMIGGILIEPNITHEYTLTITFVETGENQNYNKLKTFNTKLQILESNEYICLQNNYEAGTLGYTMLNDNCVSPANKESEFVEFGGIKYNKMTNAYQSIIDNYITTNYSSSNNKVISPSYTFNEETGEYNLTNSTASMSYSEDTMGSYTCNSTSTSCNTMYKIREIDGTTLTKVDKYTSKEVESLTNGKGLYFDSGVYFYRGNVNNNNVKFSGLCWKIVNISGNGNVKLRYAGEPIEGKCIEEQRPAFETQYNFLDTDSVFAGYMYTDPRKYRNLGRSINVDLPSDSFVFIGNYIYDQNMGKYIIDGGIHTETQIDISNSLRNLYICGNPNEEVCEEIYFISSVISKQNSNGYYYTVVGYKMISQEIIPDIDSNIKQITEDWLTTIEPKYLVENIFSNDMEGYPGNGNISIDFAGRSRVTSGTPAINQFNYIQIEEEVGLITIDEILMSGGGKNQNNYYYLNSKIDNWTMTPSHFSNIAHVYIQNRRGELKYANVKAEFPVYPVISITPSAPVSGGDGTLENPYIIEN